MFQCLFSLFKVKSNKISPIIIDHNAKTIHVDYGCYFRGYPL